MIRVLHLSKYYPPEMGGIETFLWDLVEEQKRNNNLQVDVLCFNKEKVNSTDKDENVTIFRSRTYGELVSQPISFAYISKLRQIVKNYDVIHLHFPNPLADFALLMSGFKGKLVVHWHSDVVKSRLIMLVYMPLMTWLIRRADEVIATSQNYLDGSQVLQKIKDKVSVIPLGLNTSRIKNVNERVLSGLKKRYEGRKVVFSIGRQIPYKGFQYLIRAARELPDDYVILIGGKGPLLGEHRRMVRELGLEKKVKMLGFVSDQELTAYYNLCDVYVMCSVDKSEAFGVVQLEAMYFAKPIVSTDIPGSGVPWVNHHEQTGFVIAPRDESALAEGIVKTVTSVGYSKMSANAKIRQENEFTSQIMALRISNLYQEIKLNTQ
ncbi:glycosyltransferase [Roseivirga pacifica]|uniref:glycosyltransferase n=1 Tax=Roseivirga pacifica TaxID=1267423 RepID=UPI0020941008|nr:glycosyltransferase [Roseivirga pacifica]MCO6359494.1 glycosyltransferase [Roseivirga pacifica]MCO6366864.1 glycosyltransferase [Roseivirga pacifica]MCO6370604.1 glycosyltransferase [Roseivirga pacifica]MCO6374520.1 glycosyltransferase [Roseivirga pacifica]MCO6379779.1 glycosyltransferase [Roseivirga pacifica]